VDDDVVETLVVMMRMTEPHQPNLFSTLIYSRSIIPRKGLRGWAVVVVAPCGRTKAVILFI